MEPISGTMTAGDRQYRITGSLEQRSKNGAPQLLGSIILDGINEIFPSTPIDTARLELEDGRSGDFSIVGISSSGDGRLKYFVASNAHFDWRARRVSPVECQTPRYEMAAQFQLGGPSGFGPGGLTGGDSALRLMPGRKSQPDKNGRMDTSRSDQTSDVDPPKIIAMQALIAAQQSSPNPIMNIAMATGMPARCRQFSRDRTLLDCG
jgi:hypothetical protein